MGHLLWELVTQQGLFYPGTTLVQKEVNIFLMNGFIICCFKKVSNIWRYAQTLLFALA